MLYDSKIWVAKDGDDKLFILPSMANRHGIIAGATGTGKTITLKVIAESFSDMGVPVFLADVKGDLAGMCMPGENTEDMQKRIERFGLAEAGFDYKTYPVCFWDIDGDKGLPLRTTISEMGPLLLGRLMSLTDVQKGILNMVFRIADENGLLLIDTKDLRAMIQHVVENSAEYSAQYGNMPKQSLNAILRAVMNLESQGGDRFFGEPAVNIHDWFKTDASGKGTINILDCQTLINSPLIYSTFMLWMMSELFEVLPEAGDPTRPKMVFFFDEAHLLFNDAPKAFLEKVEQVVKLIRSKGVGIFFITQNPGDIPDGVLAQLGNRIQHALRAYTPAERKKIKAAADSFRENPEFDTKAVLEELGTGEALVSFLDAKGSPAIVRRAKILPPQSKMGAIDDSVRNRQINGNILYHSYVEMVDRDSAYEFLMRQREENEAAKEAAAAEAAAAKEAEKEAAAKAKEAEKSKKTVGKAAKTVAKTAAGTVGRELGNEFGKKVGGSLGKKVGGNVGASLFRGILDTLFSK